MAIKQDLYDALDILATVYFNGKEKSFSVSKARHDWMKDKRRNPLAYPRFILIEAAEAIVKGTTVSGVRVGGEYVRHVFYLECNSRVMRLIDELLEHPGSNYLRIQHWREIAKNAGLLLTVDKINERLAEYE